MTCEKTAAVTASLRHALVVDKALQQSSPLIKAGWWRRTERIWDVLAVLVIAFVLYKLLIAPRSMPLAAARPAPHVTLTTLAGKPFVLQEHRGRVVFLDFFASWCEPCRISLPVVERFARNHPEVEVVPVDVGETPGVVAKFAHDFGLRNVALDQGKLAAAWFGVIGFPTIVVVDPRSRVRATWAGLNPAIALNMGNAERQLAKN